MTCYSFIFHDTEGNELGRVSVCSGTPVRLASGEAKLAEFVEVGDLVYFAGLWATPVDAIEVN